ncbi:MAG: hypothetical protein AAGE52_02815 [Myxococcota bacterium]
MSFPIPEVSVVREFLMTLLDRKVIVNKSKNKLNTAAIATYSDGETERGMMGVDRSFQIYSGAALALIPAATAEASRTNMSKELHENFYETMNVLSGIFSSDGDRSVIQEVVEFDDASKELRKRFRRAENRLNLELEVDGYGKAALTIAV